MGLFDKIKDIMTDEEDDFDEYTEESAEFVKPPRRREREIEPPTYEREERTERPWRHVKPEGFEEAASIADNLNARRTVVLNLESANREVARRLLDFLSGVAYANNGQIKRVANSTYIITPYNVDVMGDLIDELENNGMFTM